MEPHMPSPSPCKFGENRNNLLETEEGTHTHTLCTFALEYRLHSPEQPVYAQTKLCTETYKFPTMIPSQKIRQVLLAATSSKVAQVGSAISRA